VYVLTKNSPIINLTKHQGLSLVEIIMMMLLVVIFAVPLVLQSNLLKKTSKTQYINSSRNILMSRLVDEIDPEVQSFATAYNDASVQSITESGSTIGYMRKVDTANSTALKRRVHFYLYPSGSSGVGAYSQRYSQEYLLDELRIDCGATSTSVDNSGQRWLSDIAYNAGNKVPGYSSNWQLSNNLPLGNVITNTTNDTLYLTNAQVSSTVLGNAFTYRIPVDNGNYTVQLYFSELSSPGPITRLTDVTIESTKVLDDYNTFTALSNVVRKAEIKSFNTPVTDGELTISIENGGTANPVTNAARLAALVVRKAS
jgi:hypothetical protein